MVKTRTKRQHFVSRFYLEYFADADGKVWTFDTQTDDVRKGSPENTAVETNFYSIKDENGEYIDVLEEWLSSVEGTAAEIYPKVVNGEVLTDQEKADFAVFVSSLYMRSPAMIRSAAEVAGHTAQSLYDVVLSDRARYDKLVDEMDAAKGTITTPEERDATFEFAQDKSRYVLAVDKKIGLQSMGATDRVTELLFQMNWLVFESPRQHLITSDNPVARVTPPKSYHPIYGDGGFINKGVLVTLPLNPSRLLEISWREDALPGVYEVDKQQGRLYNRQRAHFSERYLYTSMRDDGIRALGRKYREPGLQVEFASPGPAAPVEVKRRLDK